MSNAIKIINYLQPQGEFLTFFSELNSDLKVGDRIYIIGGNYDNIKYTEKGHSEYNPFHEFATGYTVLAVDNTDNSNAITLNIQYRLAQYNLAGIDTSVFNPKPVYKTEEELLIEPNQIREAYMSKSYFKRGEFNGGIFDDGIIGEYNIQGKTSNKIYERQKFVNNLEEAENLNLNTNFDYSTLTEPATDNKVKFNNKFTSDVPATFRNGVFLGGEYQWGKWINKFDSNKEGKIQTLNEFNQPFNPLDESKFNIQKFADNNAGFGYSILVSGNVGKIYEGEHDVEFINSGTSASEMIFNDYLPYPLWKSIESNFAFTLQIRVSSPKNDKIFDIKYLDKANKKIVFEEKQRILTLDTTNTDVVSEPNDASKKYYEIEQLIFDETGTFTVELYVKDNESGIRNIIDKSIMLHPDIFGGVIDNTWMQGGDVWGGEFRKGRVSSKYSQLNWWDGIYNGKKEESFSENVRWENGTWIDGNWKGDITIPIKNYIINNTNNTLDENIFYIDIPSVYKHLFKLGDFVFISYIKKSVGSRYFQNFTDQPTEYPLNFREFELLDIIQTEELNNLLQVRLELKGGVDTFKEDVSLQYAKVSQSYFNKGVWNDGIWESGLRKVYNKEIVDVRYTQGTAGSINHNITLQLNTVENLYLGQRVEATNLEIVREIEVGVIDGVNGTNFTIDDRGTAGAVKLTFIEPLNQTLTILDIDTLTNKIIVKFPIFNKIDSDSELKIKDDYKILSIRKKLTYNEKSELGEAIWVNGEFNSGAWNGGIFRAGSFNSKLYFDINNTEIQAIFQSGYWKNGSFTNSTFLSGVWENGTIESGIVTNLFNNENSNSGTTWDNGDTIFIDGTINDVEWRRGLMLKSVFNNGKIINGGIENVKFNAGQYTNGLTVYKNDIVSNRSGRQTDDLRYVDLSAPSMIYVDGDGWIQLDQPSYFQKDYNVIFKDLDRFPNPLDGQMFDVLNRDKFGTRVKIAYSTSGENPLYLNDEFRMLKPILAVDNMVDFAQIDDNIFWIADSGNNRILIINTATRKVDVLGKILLQEDKWNFTGIKFIASAIKFNTTNDLNFVYVVDTKNNVDTLRRISLDENNNPETITDYSMPLLAGEVIIDLKVLVAGTVQETVFCLTSQNRMLYTSTKTNELKATTLAPYITSASSITPLRKTNTNSVDLLVLNNNTISHLVLDYNTTSDVYTIRTTSPVTINGFDFVNNNIKTFTAKYEGNGIDIFVIIDDAETNGNVYKFTYNEFFNGDVNSFILLNEVAIDFPIYRTKMSQYFGELNSILLHRGNPLILSSSDLFKNTTGFGNPLSQIRLLEVSTVDSLTGYAYWIYDDATDRLIFVDESNPNQYDSNNDVDLLRDASNRYEILKMTQGETKTIVYSIQRNGSIFSIRKTERGKIDNTNSTIFTINNVAYIYDIVYVDKLFILLKTINDEYRIVELNQSQSNISVYDLNYSSSTLQFPSTKNYNVMSMDIIKVGSEYIGAITGSDTTTDILEVRIGVSTLTSYKVNANVPQVVNDTVIKFEEIIDYNTPFNVYSIFFATANGVIKIVSDKLISSVTPNKLRWSEFGENVYYNTANVKEIYLDATGQRVVSSFGAEFSVMDSKYVFDLEKNYAEESNELSSFNFVVDSTEGDIVVGLSHNRLIQAHSTSAFVLDANITSTETFKIGRFQQNSTSGSPSINDFLLNNPHSLVKAKNDYIFFIDNYVHTNGTLKQLIRYYKYGSLVTPNYDIVLSGVNQLKTDIADLSYLGEGSNNRVYYAKYNGANTEIYYFDLSAMTTHVLAKTYTGNNIKKLSVSTISGNITYVVLRSDNTIDYSIGAGSWLVSPLDVTSSYPVIDDISLVNDGSQVILYFLESNKLHYIEYNGSFNASSVEDISSNNLISNISENDTNTNLLYFDKTDYITAKIGIDTSLRNEDFVDIKDFAFNPSVTTPNYIFIYNEPVSNPSGVIRQPFASQSVRLSFQKNNVSTGTFKKIVATDDNTAYVLFDEGVSGLKIYKYDFAGNVVVALGNPNPVFRSSIINPVNTTNYKLYPVDITHYNGKLIAIFEYYESGVASEFYDVFGLNNNVFDKTDISWLYPLDGSGNPLPIDNTGASTGDTYPTIVPSGVGNMQFLFTSPLAPYIYSGRANSEDYITLYFGNSPTTGDFLKLVKNSTVTPLVANEFNDLIVKITIPTFNISAETVSSVQLLPNPVTNSGSVNASSTGTGSITIGTDVISLANNEIWAVFTNSSLYTTANQTFDVVVTTTLNSGRITSTTYNTGINDFRVYESSGNNITIENTDPIDTIYANNGVYQLEHTTTGVWDIIKYNLNYGSPVAFRTLLAPVTPTATNINIIELISNINVNPLFLDGLELLDNKYNFSDITKGYKVTDDNKNSNQTLSPYLTSRVLYKTILNEGVQFNNLGTPKTAHFVASRWNNNLFLGTWDEPTYFNNKIIEDFSVFVNGIFEGDFYDGFFLGGDFRNNSNYESNIIQGHFASDNKNINIISGNVDAKYRYDIIKMYWENHLLNMTLEGLYLDGDDYKNYPISKIGKGSWIKVPNLFNKLEFTIEEIWNSKIKVDGKNEITLLIQNPSFLDVTLSTYIIKFFQDREIFIKTYEYAEELFGSFKVLNVFKKDDIIYLTVNSDFNKFNSQGKYQPIIKPQIVFNQYLKVVSAKSYIRDGKAYSDFSVDMFSPLYDEATNYRFIEKVYFKDSVEVIKTGKWKGYIQTPNYLQVFTTTLSKTDKRFKAKFGSAIENILISDVQSTAIGDDSKIQVELPTEETIIAHDVIVENSHIETTTLRNDVFIENSIILSGKVYSNVRTSAWLSVDEKGFSHGNSQLGDADNLFNFEGENVKIVDFYFEGNEFVWITLENIIFNVDKYRWITLRGFTGNKSQLIGATRSRVFRIEEVKDNTIKIRNPFLYYNDYNIENGTNFNKDRIQIAKQTMLLKGLEGDNVKCSNSDAKQFANNTFSKSLAFVETDNNWYYKTSDTNVYLYTTSFDGTNGLKATFNTTNQIYKKIHQKYVFKPFVDYTFDLNYTATNTTNSVVKFQVYFDGVPAIPNNGTVNLIGISTGTFSFSYKQFEEKEVEVTIEIQGSNTVAGVCYGVINSLEITNIPQDESYEFYYGWASPSTFNGGDFYGNFNSVWNAGNFRKGEFTGQWFGSEENNQWNGKVWVDTIPFNNRYQVTVLLDESTRIINNETEILGGASVEIGDFVYLHFNSVFNAGVIEETFGGYYGVVTSSTSGLTCFVFETDDNIPTDKYSVNITTYRKQYSTDNYLVNDYNFNVKINDNPLTRKFMDWNIDETLVSGTNAVLLFDGINHINTIDYINKANAENGTGFSIDLTFKYDTSLTIQPLLAFQNSNTGLTGIKLFIRDNNIYLKYKSGTNEQEYQLNTTTLSTNDWYHVLLTFGSNIHTEISKLISGSYVLQNSTNVVNTIEFVNYDITFIGKMLNLEADKSISTYTYKGKMDEIRIWNLDLTTLNSVFDSLRMRNFLFDSSTGKLNKFVNRYVPELSAYWNADKTTTLDTGSYYPEEETYFVLRGDNAIVLQDDLQGTNFAYRGNNLFLELDFFAEQYTDSADSRGEYKILTIEETRNLPNNEYNKYYLELILKEVNKTFFYFIIREKVTNTSDVAIDDLVYPFDSINNSVDYSKDIIFSEISNYREFYNWYNLIITDNELYINGEKIGEYNLSNRNVFKYTVDTNIILGKYEFAKILGTNIPVTKGVRGFISNANLWENKKYKDEYAVYRILSGENTDLYNNRNDELTSNILLKSGSAGQNVIPTFNSDGSNIWETYIYSSENNYTAPVTKVKDLNIDYLTTSLPSSNWLEGTDFNIITTNQNVIKPNNQLTLLNNNNYLLTKDFTGTNGVITISNMENFKFFGKKVADSEGNARLNVTDNGYLFFEDLILNNLNYPLFKYSDNTTSLEYNQVSTTDAIMFSNTLDIRSYKDGFVKWVDRDNEFIIEFYGKSTKFNKTNVPPFGDKYSYNEAVMTSEINSQLFSFYAIRIDKINSNVLVYIRRIDESADQKILGLRRSDGYWSYINDTSGLVNYYKQPNGKDFVIGYASTKGDVISSNNTEYIVFTPRFNVEDQTKNFVDYIANKDYDYLATNHGLKVYKQFKGTLLNQYKVSIDGTALTGINKKYIELFPVYKDVIINNFTNSIYDINEQYRLNSSSFLFNGLNDETETLVTRASFFYDGIFNAPVWHNGIFVNGLVNRDNFIWKYGIKHNGRIEGGEELSNYAHWLGGYHLGQNESSFVRNLVWLRGIFDGGTWERGHWLSLDLNNHYKNGNKINNDWSIWRSGEWYSRVDENIVPQIQNLFTDANNGTFGSAVSNWNLNAGNVTINSMLLPSTTTTYCARVTMNTSSSSYGTLVKAFKGNSQIPVNRNTEYTVTANVMINTGYNGGIKITAIGDSNVINKLNIAYRRDGANSCKYDIQENNSNKYELIAESGNTFVATIKHTFNTGDNDFIYIQANTYSNNVSFQYYITNIQIIGENIKSKDFNPYDIKNHDSVWHGGIWESEVKETGEVDEFGNPIFFKHTWESDDNKLYQVKNNQILTLPTVNSIWLGGLWLRGEFRGGIFSNGYWHSVDCQASTSSYVYEQNIGQVYNSTSSVFYNGKMINSIWYGGTVSNTGDKLDVVFGDLVNLDSNLTNSKDFTWKHDEFKFKRSDFSKAYSNDILGRETFVGYHFDPINDGSEKRASEIEKNRVRRQVNSDGIMSVYWKRGSFDNGVFQFSHWDSLDLNEERQTIISEVENKNNSIFRKGIVHSSMWKSGLFYAHSSRDRYPFNETDEPNSLFYYSRWEKGYWKAKGLKNMPQGYDLYPFYSSLDTTDNIEITNALFSRSLWDAGVFEGGTIDLSIWRSGVSDSNVKLEYKNSTVNLTQSTNTSNLAFLVSGKAGTNSDYLFSTNFLVKGFDFVENDNTFVTKIGASKYRYAGSVDNLASIFVNGRMKGSVWHGGTWQRGIFEHTNVSDIDFFDRDVNSNPSLDKYQLGIWNRGLWLSGYFSYYDDKIIDKKNINPQINNSYLFNNANTSEAGRRSLFMSFDAENVTDNGNIIGINTTNFNNLLNVIKYNVNNKNNYASFFMRRLLKERTDRGSVNVYANKKPYFSVMNGSVLNGVLYQDIDFAGNAGHEDRYILSLFSTVSDSYNKTAYNNQYRVSTGNIAGDKDAFIYELSYSKSTIDKFIIPYSNLSPLTWDTSQWTPVNNNGTYIQLYLSNYNNGFATPTVPFPHIWRHNYDERTLSGVLFGDGTIVNGTSGLRPMIYNSNNNQVQVSIAQGNGMLWIVDEAQGEPKYKGDEMELTYSIISFFSNNDSPQGIGYDDIDFDT